MKSSACVLAALLAGQTLVATTYFVSPSGNNSNPGTEGEPWASLQKAADTMSAGDTVMVQSGNYAGWVSKANGSAESYLTFQGNGWPIITNDVTITHTHHRLSGFSFKGFLSVNMNGHSTQIISNRWLDTGANAMGLAGGPGQSVTPLAPTNCLVGWNVFSNINYGMFVQGRGHTIASNFFAGQTEGDAIVFNSSNGRIVGNTFTNWTRPVGSPAHVDIVQAFADNGEISTNNIFEGNFAINCVGTQIGNFSDDRDHGMVGDWTFRNNLYVNVEGSMSMYNPGMKFYNNTFYKSGRSTGAAILFRASGWLLPFTVDLDTDVLTVDTNLAAMPFTTGGRCKVQNQAGTLPAPLVNRGWFFCRVLSTTTLALYLSEADAINDVSRVNMTNSGTGPYYVTTTGYRGTAHNGEVFNNVFYECGSLGTGSWGLTASGSPWWLTPTNFLSGNHIIKTVRGGTDPLFVNASTNSLPAGFKLQSGSPAIGAGTNLNSYFTTDFDGVTRGSSWDIGAWQYQAAGALLRPASPNGLRLVSN